VALAFWPALDAGFLLYDDDDYVTDNPRVRAGVTGEGVAWAFTTFSASNWHPLTWLSHQLDFALFGLEPAGHHATNVLLHAANALLVLALLVRTTGAFWPGAFAAALFALHPLRVESVAWVAERKDVLSTAFGLLALLAWTAWVRGGARRWYAAALLAYFASLASKAMWVTLPFALLLFDLWPLARWRPGRGAGESWLPSWRLVREKLPFFALAALASLLALAAQQQALWTLRTLGPGARIENALVAYARYLGKALWPADLSIFYPHPRDWPPGAVLASAALLLGVTALALRQIRRRPYLFVGWAFYLGTLVPVIGLVQIGAQSIADRYTYVPLLGPTVALAWGARELAAHSPAALRAVTALALVALVACGAAAHAYARAWRDDLTIFGHALESTGENALAHHVLGLARFRRGEIAPAIAHYEKALALEPGNGLLHYNAGLAFERAGRSADAIRLLERAVELRPTDARARFALGDAYLRARDGARAEAAYRGALALETRWADLRDNLGMALAQQGRLAEAADEFRAALELHPEFASAHQNLGRALDELGDAAGAASHYAETLRLAPQAEIALRRLARIRAAASDPALRDPAEARLLAERLCALTGCTSEEDRALLEAVRAAGSG
jgi:Flp pilus assembly protein TadD